MSTNLWDVYEINLTTTNIYSNPYLDIWLNATFTGSTKTIRIDGFWDGGQNWKIRMVPIEAGTWSFITSSNDAQLNGKKGTFTVTESGKKGFVKVNPAYPYSFVYDDGTPFFFLGDTAWQSTDPVYFPFDGTFQNYIDTRASQGFTALQINLQLTAGASEGGPAFPNYPNTTTINPGYYQWLDKRIEYTNQKGMIVQMSFTWADNYGSFGQTNYKNYIKYVMSRYATYDVFFSVIGEYEEVGNWTAMQSAGQYTETVNPYNHPVTIHTVDTTTDAFSGQSWITHHQQQNKVDTVDNWNTNVISDRSDGKPVILSEVCYEAQTEYGCTNNGEYRKAAWASTVSGGYYIYGHNNIKGAATKDWSKLYSPGAYEMGYLRAFWDKIEYWKMFPSNSLVSSGYAIANLGKEYVIYLPSGGSTTADLSTASGTLSIEWYSPRTGTYQGKTTVQGGASITFTAPDTNDWVLHIYADTCPPVVCNLYVE